MRVTDTVADRKPRYRRPPARLYADVQPSPSPSPLGSSLQSLAQRATINNKTTQKSSSLQSLAQKAAGQRGMSALQTLASRQQQRTATTPSNTTTTTSPSSSPKPSSLAALAQKSSASKGRTSLAHLATRSNPSETSTRPPSSNQGLSALAKLASKPNMSDKPTSLSPSLEKQQQQQQQQEVEETMKPVTTPEKTLPMINDQPANPLCAKPSAAANFLFMHMYPQQTNAASLPIPAFSSIGQVFYDAVKPLDDTIKVFSFDVPSPDDVVMEAQSHRSGGQLRKS
ncbi:hypothetical protein K492DRAFT_9925 [Lichtheimia hyalospora FSU 10163]|nr:hypothetical protein K492DRAFT_9925 [Lichtheimia hyalospora FSU 10163]